MSPKTLNKLKFGKELKMWNQVEKQVWDQVWNQVLDQVRDQVGNQVKRGTNE